MARGSIVDRTQRDANGKAIGPEHYAVVVSFKDTSGKRKQVWKTAKSKRTAEKLRTDMLSKMDNGTFSQAKGTLGEYLSRWLAEYVKSNLGYSTYQGYEYIIRRHIIPSIGGVAMKSLKAEVLQHYYAGRLESGLSSTSVRHHHALLRRALKQAVMWGLLGRNPADLVSPPRARKVEMRTLDTTQVADVLRGMEDTPFRYMVFLAVNTGLRRGELLGLRWSDVSLEGAELSVTRSVTQLPGGKYVIKDTKTARSRRAVALSPQTCLALRLYLDSQMALKARLGIPFANDSLIFCHLDGSPLRGNSVSQSWRRMVRRMGLVGIRWHDLRHTMASTMLQAGIHPKIVQERLGHASIATTLDLYSHVAPGLQHAAAGQLDSLFAGKSVSKALASTH